MHMADALLSPEVGATCWLASGAVLAWCARSVKQDHREDMVPLMGVLGAFVFAAQMVNFSIPGTGSSGHIVGALLLSILLGPQAALIVIASVLTVQALFFADGGLLALGANLFNMGVMSCLVAYPLIYRTLMPRGGELPSARRMAWAAVLTSVVGLQLGALGVVMQTRLSGVSSLPVGAFLWLMQPIHLAIGLGEGLATAALLVFIRQARPDLLMARVAPGASHSSSRLLTNFGALALITASMLSWFASSHPDGLEWSLARITGRAELVAPESAVHAKLSAWQAATAIFRDYSLDSGSKRAEALVLSAPAAPKSVVNPDFGSKQAVARVLSAPAATKTVAYRAWPAVDAGTSLAGILGGLMTLTLVLGVGYWLKRRTSRAL